MKYIVYTILLFSLVACSAAHNSKVRDNINKEYGANKKKKKTHTSSKSERPKIEEAVYVEEIKVVAPARSIETEQLTATSDVRVSKDIILDYIDVYKDAAMESMRDYGIPASIKLAQGILESGSGSGRLCNLANNHFGIKCHNVWTGPSVSHTDDAPDECFRKYDNPFESYRDHSLFLTSRSRYNFLFELDKGDYVSWARGLRKAGYATDVKYPDKLIGLIERYNLYEYDKQVLGAKYHPVTRINPVADGQNFYAVESGDTLFAISRKFNISVDDLKNWNRLSSNVISVGQILKVKS